MGDAGLGQLDVGRIEVVADGVAAGALAPPPQWSPSRGRGRPPGRPRRCTARSGAGAARPGTGPGGCTRSALSGGMSHTSRERAMKSSALMLATEGRPALRRSLGLSARPKRPLLATMTRSVTSRSTGLAGERKDPQAHEPAGPVALLPDDLAPGQQVQVVLEDGHHVGGQAAVGLAAEVGHVDGDPPARLEHPLALGEHLAQELEVLEVGTRHPFTVELLLVLLAGEVGRRGDHQGHRVVGHGVHPPGVAADAGLEHGVVRGDVLVRAQLRVPRSGRRRRRPRGTRGARHRSWRSRCDGVQPWEPSTLPADRRGAGDCAGRGPGHGGHPREPL